MEANTTVGADRFRLTRALGRGGMGEVWLAQDERLREPVALKFLPAEVRNDASALDDLRGETARSHRLTHQNIVRIHDLHEDSGSAFISMEFVDGPTFAALRVEQPTRVLPWDFLKPLVQQLCAALEYAHQEKIIHRDLKPANMMLDGKGRLKLADFGIAATVNDATSRISLRHATSGTLAYMSPQQLAGKRPSVADDIYALGATLYELLTSKPPFYTGDLTHQVLNEPPEPLDERLAALGIANEIPADVAALIMACLAKDPAQRPQCAAAVAGWIGLDLAAKPSTERFAAQLAHAGAALESTADDASANPAVSARDIFKSRWLWPGLGTAALVLLVLGGWFWRERNARQAAAALPNQAAGQEPKTSANNGNSSPNVETRTTVIQPSTGTESWQQWQERIGASGASPNGTQNFNYWKTVFDRSGIKGKLWKDPNGDIKLDLDKSTSDLAPLKGMPLHTLFAAESQVRDLIPLQGMPIKVLGLRRTQVKDLSPLRGLPIEQLALDECENLQDLTPLADCQRLESLSIPASAHNIDFLRRLSNLRHLAFSSPSDGNWERVITADEFWKRFSDNGPATNQLSWQRLFDGKTLSGWTAVDPGDWHVATDGSLVSIGPQSHLFSPNRYTNLEFKAEIQLSPEANCSLGFRAQRMKGVPTGYMAKANLDVKHPLTGSLFKITHPNQRYKQELPVRIPVQHAPTNAPFTMHIVAIGNRIVGKMNDQILTDYVDPSSPLLSGHLFLEHWHPGAAVNYRKVMVKPLPADESAAWAEARKDMPDLKP